MDEQGGGCGGNEKWPSSGDVLIDVTWDVRGIEGQAELQVSSLSH